MASRFVSILRMLARILFGPESKHSDIVGVTKDVGQYLPSVTIGNGNKIEGSFNSIQRNSIPRKATRECVIHSVTHLPLSLSPEEREIELARRMAFMKRNSLQRDQVSVFAKTMDSGGMAQILSENSQDAYLFTVTVLDEEDVDFCSIGENESDMEEIFNADDLPPCIVAKRFFEERTTYLADKMKLRVLVVANALDCTLPTRIVLDGLSAIPVELSDKSLEIYV